MELLEFNGLSEAEAAKIVGACASVDRWVREIAAGRPYGTVDELVAATQSAANPWTEAEIDSALARHPRIGERAKGADADAKMSRQEQAGLGITDNVQARLDAANAAYEKRFGFVFLIRAAGRTAPEILEALTHRLENTLDQERHIAADQLREIAALRLKGMVT